MKQKLIEGRNIVELNTKIANENALGWVVVSISQGSTIICLLEKREEK